MRETWLYKLICCKLWKVEDKVPDVSSKTVADEEFVVDKEGGISLTNVYSPGPKAGVSDSSTSRHQSTTFDERVSQLFESGDQCDDSKLEEQPWYYGDISYNQASILLLEEGVRLGSYLVRKRPLDDGKPYALSMRISKTDGDADVKHFYIVHDSEGYYITKGFHSDSLVMLVKVYAEESKNLGFEVPLERPLPKIEEEDLEAVRRQFEIERHLLNVETKTLGSGRYGSVYLGKYLGNVVAVKALDENLDRSDLTEEFENQYMARHRNVVLLLGICSLDEPYYIVMEYMELGDLNGYIREHKLHQLQKVHVLAQVAAGMAHLESLGIVHRDLAARNVLLKRPLVAKISDFGLSRLLDQKIYEAVTERPLPIKWMAPESYYQGMYSNASDVWSFGILAVEVFEDGKLPYHELGKLHQTKLFEKIDEGYRIRLPRSVDLVLREMVYSCWSKSPEERPSFGSLEKKFNEYIRKKDNPYS